MSKPVATGSDEHLRQAKEELDQASERYAKAQSDLIHAQRRYNEASRAYAARYLDPPRTGIAGFFDRYMCP
jgi:predicted lipoprotein